MEPMSQAAFEDATSKLDPVVRPQFCESDNRSITFRVDGGWLNARAVQFAIERRLKMPQGYFELSRLPMSYAAHVKSLSEAKSK
jgi:hypothetical protein